MGLWDFFFTDVETNNLFKMHQIELLGLFLVCFFIIYLPQKIINMLFTYIQLMTQNNRQF